MQKAFIVLAVMIACLANDATVSVAAQPNSDARATAARIDASLQEHATNTAPSTADSVTPTTIPVDDATFLRRVYLDLLGTPPTPELISAFTGDEEPRKREFIVEALLDDPRFGRNWANYWRDTMMSRRTDNRIPGQVDNSLTRYLTAAFNRGDSWDTIARSFITARGDVSRKGAATLYFSQQGKAEESAAEVSRIFLGIQISCAQCHDHPTDSWTREQFHELAAFFPRMRVRADFADGRRTFKVVSQDRGPRVPRVNPKNGRRRPPIEHFMSDLEDPAADGTRMTPKFFVNDKSLRLGTPDAKRREQLAEWIVEPANPWFARAFVNRIWAELVGWGFYEPVDDLGPERDVDAEASLDHLAQAFVDSGHDIKWLFRTITATDAYAQRSRSRDPSGRKQLLANSAQPLRGDALFDALVVALNMPRMAVDVPKPAKLPELAPLKGRPATDKDGDNEATDANTEMEQPEDAMPMEAEMDAQMAKMKKRGRGARKLFKTAFDYDPSLPREEIQGSIPQALAMMNAPQIQSQIRARRRGSLIRKITDEHKEDSEVVRQLYLYCLSRDPSQDELSTCLDYIKTVERRDDALEDIQWSLINSAEFRHRR